MEVTSLVKGAVVDDVPLLFPLLCVRPPDPLAKTLYKPTLRTETPNARFNTTLRVRGKIEIIV